MSTVWRSNGSEGEARSLSRPSMQEPHLPSGFHHARTRHPAARRATMRAYTRCPDPDPVAFWRRPRQGRRCWPLSARGRGVKYRRTARDRAQVEKRKSYGAGLRGVTFIINGLRAKALGGCRIDGVGTKSAETYNAHQSSTPHLEGGSPERPQEEGI